MGRNQCLLVVPSAGQDRPASGPIFQARFSPLNGRTTRSSKYNMTNYSLCTRLSSDLTYWDESDSPAPSSGYIDIVSLVHPARKCGLLIVEFVSPIMASRIDPSIPPIKHFYHPDANFPNNAQVKGIISKLGLEEHPEGGYFVQTDRDNLRVPNPYLESPNGTLNGTAQGSEHTRNASTTIFYYLTPQRSLGVLHRNKPRCIHTLHRGRGRYVVIHAPEVASPDHPNGYGGTEGESESSRWTGKARVESFIVGPNVEKGERLQWIVEGGTYKGSFLLPDDPNGRGSDGLLISETVVPGFEWGDHDYMKPERLEALVTDEQRKELEWMLRKDVQ
jgi:uncharacterized protein